MATLTTPTYALPYPDGAERVMDGDNAMGALALAVENIIAALHTLVPVEVRAAIDQALTNADVLLNGVTANVNTPARAETVVVVAVASFTTTTLGGGAATCSLYVDDAVRGGAAFYDAPAVPATANVVQIWVIPLQPGAHVFQLRVKKVNAAGVVTAKGTQSKMLFVRIPTG